MAMQEVSKECVAIIAHVDTSKFTSDHQRMSLYQQLHAVTERTGKAVVMVDSGIWLEQLTDDQLKEIGLMTIPATVSKEYIDSKGGVRPPMPKQFKQVTPDDKAADTQTTATCERAENNM